MPLPPKGDPQRQVHLALRSMCVLGALLIFAGLILSLELVASAQHHLAISMLWMGGAGLMLGLGVGFIVLGIAVDRRHRWAITIAIYLTAIAMIAVICFVVMRFELFNLFALYIAFVLVASLIRQMYHLLLSYRAIELDSARRGFTPLIPVSLLDPPHATSPAPLVDVRAQENRQ